MASVILSNIGDLKLCLGNTPPAGYLSMSEGNLLSRDVYSGLWNWANSKGLVISESAWQTEFTNNGTCAKFSTGNGSTTFRMPKVVSIFKADAANKAGTFNKAVYNNQHFHGMGDMPNNNGTWGKLSYTTSYPSGTTGWFWNGKGGHSETSAPVTNGSVITSYNIGNDSAEVPTPASTNLMLCIRYTTDHQETAGIAQTAQAAEVIDALIAEIDNVNSGVKIMECVWGEAGWVLYSSGEIRCWGKTQVGEVSGIVKYPLTFVTRAMNINLTLMDPDDAITDVCVARVTSDDESGFNYKVAGDFASTAYLSWSASGIV